jgi:hypothetical protein
MFAKNAGHGRWHVTVVAVLAIGRPVKPEFRRTGEFGGADGADWARDGPDIRFDRHCAEL